MRKLAVILMTVMFGWSLPAFAAPVGNPAKLSQGPGNNLVVGYEGSVVFDRDLERNGAEIDGLQDSYARVAYIPAKIPVEFYGLMGATRFEVDQGNAGYETDFGFAYGFGTKAQLWENQEGTAVGIDAKYRRSEPGIDESTFSNRGDVTYQDWQVALGISQELKEQLALYGGIKYNDLSITSVPGFASQHGDDVVGLFAGVGYDAAKDVTLNLEGDFVNETALTGGVTVKF